MPSWTTLLGLCWLALCHLAAANRAAQQLLAFRDSFWNGARALPTWGDPSSNPCTWPEPKPPPAGMEDHRVIVCAGDSVVWL